MVIRWALLSGEGSPPAASSSTQGLHAAPGWLVRMQRDNEVCREIPDPRTRFERVKRAPASSSARIGIGGGRRQARSGLEDDLVPGRDELRDEAHLAASDHACLSTQQRLNFLPEPHGHGRCARPSRRARPWRPARVRGPRRTRHARRARTSRCSTRAPARCLRAAHARPRERAPGAPRGARPS